MIERAIENWLTKTNERNYQAAYCQVLMHQGHRVLFSSSHGPMEQGKDIITLGPDGWCHAYQTKTGDIGLGEWRSIAGEIQELIELPVDYPGVDKTQIHRAYLVTNGSIKDPVRVQITDRNEDNERKNRQYAQLDVIARDSLLKSFVDAQGRFVPHELPDMRAFLELYLDDGRGMLHKDKLFAVLAGAAFGEAPGKKSDADDAITSSLIAVSYLLNSFERAENYTAMAEGWAVLASCIARYVSKHAIAENHWRVSLDLVLAEVRANLALLRKDTVSRTDFLEGDIRVDGSLLLRARTTIVLGLLAFHEISPIANRPRDTSPDEVRSLIRQHLGRRLVWGDSAFPYIFYIVKFLETNGEQTLAQDLLIQLFGAVIDSNLAAEGPLFPGPYVMSASRRFSGAPFRIACRMGTLRATAEAPIYSVRCSKCSCGGDDVMSSARNGDASLVASNMNSFPTVPKTCLRGGRNTARTRRGFRNRAKAGLSLSSNRLIVRTDVHPWGGARFSR